ncbi:hypothetical protein AB0J80_36435 [Actinoplanes sp. NPDC049548]|uniref:hypothetical protein n=1 Tax=Actinoplanes sp. NPDC049548 TaxID=3155152 RepID=UPI00344501C9
MSAVSWEDFARLAGAPVTMTLRGRVESSDGVTERMTFVPPDNWRIEDDRGRLRYLANDTGHYQWPEAGGDEPACFQPRRPGFWHSGGSISTDLVRPRELTDPRDDDFTRPAGPVEQVTVLGRPAWQVLLLPPPRKPQPVWQVLDVESGVILAYRSPDGVPLLAFTELVAGAPVPPETFTTR